MTNTRKRILEGVQEKLQSIPYIQSARIYGSWLYNELSVDMDIAICVESNLGIVNAEHYRGLREVRDSLAKRTNQDIDLVPHTIDEFTDQNSPLWYPRYNPSLVFGRDIKNTFRVIPISTASRNFSFADLTAYVLHDNRTICRRQLIRSFNGEEGRIFVSKLLHGPGNALTFQACKSRMEYAVPPSNLEESFRFFDKFYGVDSTPALSFLSTCKKSIEFERGILLMNWYESLFNLVIRGVQFKTNYQSICHALYVH